MKYEPYLDNHGVLIPEDDWHSFLRTIDSSLVPESDVLDQLQRLLVEAVRRRVPADALEQRGVEKGQEEKNGVENEVEAGKREKNGVENEVETGKREKRDVGKSDRKKIGVLFSGGIDSTLIAFLLQKLGVEFLCLSVGFHDGAAKIPEDLIESEKVAEKLHFPHERVILDLAGVEALFKETVAILSGVEGEQSVINVVNVGVGSVEVAAFKKGASLGITHYFGGLGSEEIFAGYDRHEEALLRGGPRELHAECLAGLDAMYQRDLIRDTRIARAFNVTLSTPFLDEELIRYALRIPPSMKINDAVTFTGRGRGDVPAQKRYKKLVLREAARKLGLPRAFAFRPKRAAQYGSRTNNALTKLRKLHGFRDKATYLQWLANNPLQELADHSPPLASNGALSKSYLNKRS